jgi:UDP:flavonoid glycosyltransferase YjiC (YdhE family)
MADQPYWGRRIQQLGAGMPFIRRHKLTRDKLASAIQGMTSDRGMQVRAAQIGEQIRAEDGVGNAVRAIQKMTMR